MKKLLIAIMATFMLSTVAMAQDVNTQGKRFNGKEMIQKRTDRMVKQYGLSNDQAEKLLKLNTDFAANWQGRAGFKGGMKNGFHGKRGMRGGMKRGGMGMKGCANCDSCAMCSKDSTAIAKMKETRMAKQKERADKFKAGMAKVKSNMDEYNTKLKGIMTDEQFAKYQDNKSKFKAPRRFNKDKKVDVKKN